MRSSKEIKRILIVRTDRLGDVVLTLPILPILRSCFPDAHIAMLLKQYTGQIVEGNPCLDEIIWYDELSSPIPFLRMRTVLSKKRFDAAVVVYPRFRLACLVASAGIPLRVGTGYRYYSVLFNRRVYEHRRDAKKHEVEYNIGLLRELGCHFDGRPSFTIQIPDDVRKRVTRKLGEIGAKRIVVLHPGSGGSAREWGPENFGKLGRRIAGDGTVSVLITGTEAEERIVSRVMDEMDGKGIPLVGQLSVKEFAALLERTSLFVSNSTGPLHIAAAVGAPVIGLYPQHTAMSARRWGPWTDRKQVFIPDKPTNCNDCVREGGACSCMDSIGVDAVYSGAIRLLAGKPPRETIVSAASGRSA